MSSSDAGNHVMVMEATGVYYLGFARAAHAAGFAIRVVNPWQVRLFASSRLSRTKTDKVDAVLIRDFGERMLPDLVGWHPAPEGLERVSALVRLGDGLMRHRVAADNRVHALQHVDKLVAEVAAPIGGVLRVERDRVMREAAAAAREDPLVSVWLACLMELPGFGETTALRFLAYSGDLRRFGGARRFAAFTGLTPRFQQSGDGLEVGVISRVGPRQLRSILYWAAISAGHSNSPMGDMYRRLVSAGKPKKVAVVAVANRLARAAWSVCVQG